MNESLKEVFNKLKHPVKLTTLENYKEKQLQDTLLQEHFMVCYGVCRAKEFLEEKAQMIKPVLFMTVEQGEGIDGRLDLLSGGSPYT